MVRIGIVGCNYGRTVHIPAFRLDSRCKIQAIAATDPARAAQAASACDVPLHFGNWRELVEHREVDAVVIATPPPAQPEIAMRALDLGKPVLAEKPMAADVEGALAMLQRAGQKGRPSMVDFNFAEVMSWQRAKGVLDDGGIGALRHVFVTWNVENYATRHRTGWKSSTTRGGGALFNLVSHSFYYLEWFCGPIVEMSAQLSALPGEPRLDEATEVLSLKFASGATGGLCMSSASYLGSGHRLEFYGEDGSLALINETREYMRGFRLFHARRPAASLDEIDTQDELERRYQDDRVAPTSRIATRFLDAIERGTRAHPDFAAGYRVQLLLNAARQSNRSRTWIETPVSEP